TGTQTAVTFGGIPATGLVYVNSTTVNCVTPAGAAPGSVNVGLSTFGGTPVVLTNGYTYYNPPTIASIIPSRGSTNGGQTVTISGANFVSGMTVVNFGVAHATAVTVA